MVEDKLFSHFGGRTTSPVGKPARMGRWVMTLSSEKNKEVRWADFLAFWLRKFCSVSSLSTGLNLPSFR